MTGLKTFTNTSIKNRAQNCLFSFAVSGFDSILPFCIIVANIRIGINYETTLLLVISMNRFRGEFGQANGLDQPC